METPNFCDLTDAEALNHIASMIDYAGDNQSRDLTQLALRLLDDLTKRTSLAGTQQVLLHYFRANAFENELCMAGEAISWAWEIPNLEKIILELRKAIRHEGFSALETPRQCQILTNLGNKLNSVGRPIEAIAQWDRAIALNPNFAMALGNKGQGLSDYAQSLYDGGHTGVLLSSAFDSLEAACARNAMYDSPESYAIRSRFSDMASRIADYIDTDAARAMLLRDFSLGRSKAEQAYREWALRNRLFLNPLNDLGTYSIAANDVLHLPTLTTGMDERGAQPPTAFGFYNQLKQEFVSARWLLFEGVSEHRPHFSDRGTHFYDTLNIPAYSLAVEKTKLALRMAYSLLDKIAFFINDYFKVGLPEKAVSFRSIWHERKGEPKPLASVFKDRPNWPLRGLYWLSKDVYEPSFQEVAEPSAEGLAELRNHIEHKYCQIHEDLGMGYSSFATSLNDAELGFRVGRDTLEIKSLDILQKSRAALVYLSLAVHCEEIVRKSARDAGYSMEMHLAIWKERGRL